MKPSTAQQKKHRERRWPDPLELLARIERLQPGRLASWLRSHPPGAAEEGGAPHAVFVRRVRLLRRR